MSEPGAILDAHPELYPFGRCHPELQAKDPRIGDRHRRLGLRQLSLLLAALLVFAVAIHASAQGCAQCLDSTRATPPQVQAAYRHAIYLLGGVGALLFIAGAVILRRER